MAGSQGDADQGDAKRAGAKLADAARGDATQGQGGGQHGYATRTAQRRGEAMPPEAKAEADMTMLRRPRKAAVKPATATPSESMPS